MEYSVLPKPEKTVDVILKGTKVAIAIPSYGDSVSVQTLNGVSMTFGQFMKHGIQAALLTSNDSILHKNRNILVDMFLETDADYLIFIDSDMGFAPESILRLIASAKMMEADIIGAAGLQKTENKRFCCELLYPLQMHNATNLIKVSGIGTAFLLISRKVLEHLAYPAVKFKTSPGSDKLYAQIFENEIDEEGNFWSEDYAFCRKARKAGFDLWLDPSIELSHVGKKEWKGAPLEDIREKFIDHTNCPFGIISMENKDAEI